MNRIILAKMGSNSLLDQGTQRLNERVINEVADGALRVRQQDIHDRVLLVTSGAVASGREATKYAAQLEKSPLLQHLLSNASDEDRKNLLHRCAAAIGQPQLTKLYERALRKAYKNIHGYEADEGMGMLGQILPTPADLKDGALEKVVETLLILLESDVIPLVNGNDATSVPDLVTLDNDKMATKLLLALQDYLKKANFEHEFITAFFTDKGGVFDRDPHEEGATVMEEIRVGEQLDAAIQRAEAYEERKKASGKTGNGTGGMVSKLEQAKALAEAGNSVFIGAWHSGILEDIARGKTVQNGTWVRPSY